MFSYVLILTSDVSSATIQSTGIPTEVQVFISEFEDIFQTPTTLPPPRPFDHHVQLIPGAQLVNIRPYDTLLCKRMKLRNNFKKCYKMASLNPSCSPYASPVLLVKKDGTWRFCVSYRHLNAQTVKNKHPMPMVEELLDELVGAKWFTKLDFRAGYHQICIEVADTHKNCFQNSQWLV